MNLVQLENILADQPPFRLKQIKKAIFKDLVENWFQVTTLPLTLRQELQEKCPLKIQGKTVISADKSTEKALITLNDGLKIESVLLRHKDKRNTVCLSSQIGCLLGCVFCATGKMGFKRNLDTWEIVEQVLFFARFLKKEKDKVTNLVFMGMGEPFLNYDNVLGAVRILNDKEGFNLGARHISISTSGIVEGIKKLSQEKLQVNLAISLHAPDDELRSKIMPINKKYSIGKILQAVDNYIQKTGRRVMFEYLLIKGVNDSDQNALKLANLVKKPLYFVNLIVYNPTGVFRPPSPGKIQRFKRILTREQIPVTCRYRFGQDIKAACGQLATGKTLKSFEV